MNSTVSHSGVRFSVAFVVSTRACGNVRKICVSCIPSTSAIGILFRNHY